jgi:hypothetical protein
MQVCEHVAQLKMFQLAMQDEEHADQQDQAESRCGPRAPIDRMLEGCAHDRIVLCGAGISKCLKNASLLVVVRVDA